MSMFDISLSKSGSILTARLVQFTNLYTQVRLIRLSRGSQNKVAVSRVGVIEGQGGASRVGDTDGSLILASVPFQDRWSVSIFNLKALS